MGAPMTQQTNADMGETIAAPKGQNPAKPDVRLGSCGGVGLRVSGDEGGGASFIGERGTGGHRRMVATVTSVIVAVNGRGHDFAPVAGEWGGTAWPAWSAEPTGPRGPMRKEWPFCFIRF